MVQKHFNKNINREIFLKDATFMDVQYAEEFIRTADKSEFLSGIYCFFTEDFIPLYVGQSDKLFARLYSHLVGDRIGTTTHDVRGACKYVGFICTEFSAIEYERLTDTEKRMIIELKPIFNGNPRGVYDTYGYENLYEWLRNFKDSKIRPSVSELLEEISRYILKNQKYYIYITDSFKIQAEEKVNQAKLTYNLPILERDKTELEAARDMLITEYKLILEKLRGNSQSIDKLLADVY